MRFGAWVLTLGLVLAAVVAANRLASGQREPPVTLFTATQPGCAIVIPRDAIDAERRAAEMLRDTLAKAAGQAPDVFPVLTESSRATRPAIYVGATQRGAGVLQRPAKPPYDTAVTYVVRAGAVVIRSERRESIQSAASWFLEKELSARWFIPGPLGESIPRRSELILERRTETVRPGFIHRDLSPHGPGAGEWYARNRLEARFEHGHNLGNIFLPADLARVPDLAPLRNGAKFIPAPNRHGFQPNLVHAATAEHAARVASRAFDADPKRLSFSLSANDTDRYDESPETLAAVAPPRFFRHRPDYSDLVFGFSNAVAARVARRHPDRWLPAYAYYWSENAPRFPLERNVIPFLTADRSRWSFPAFAAEDKALIEKFCRSGAEIVGVYDYYYGIPYFCPRPILYAVKESIPFAYRAGVRAFYAESSPNWAFDGPKAWLTAQLLWLPNRNPDDLLEIYYREFWGEAAGPMRRFFEICEHVWQNQPGPPLWLRYYQDEHQAHIFSAADRRKLREQLTVAEGLARTEVVRARVAMASAALAVTEVYAEFCSAREAVHRLSRENGAAEPLFAAWKRYRELGAEFTRRHGALQREQPLALGPQDHAIYLRNQPDGRVAQALCNSESGRALLRERGYLAEVYLAATESDLTALLARGKQVLNDRHWDSVKPPSVLTSAVIDWLPRGGTWHGEGEPWEGRTIQLNTQHDGQRVLRLASCRTEGIGQWLPATPHALYVAQAKVRAKSSSGTATYLIVNFLDRDYRHLGIGRVDRLPAGADVQETELTVITRAPANARYIGFGLRAQNQINDDFVEFSNPSLRVLAK